jgi:PAS domain S-box-containing protein
MLRLLILEDNPYDADLEVAMLEKAGYVCQWERVETRTEFLAHLDTPDYDVILADYNLPAFDGLTALKLFLERGLDLPFILVSGLLGEELAIESLKAGATDYVLKDRLSRLGPVVERALREKEEQRQRRQTEEALGESEARYRDLFRNSVLGIYRTTPDGRILVANPALVQMLGYPSFEELAQRNLEEGGIVPPYERSTFKEHIEGERQIIGLESVWLRRDGTKVFVRENARAICDEKGCVLYYDGTVENITERVRSEEERARAEEALRKSEVKYRTLFTSIADPILIFDRETLRFLDCNQKALDRYGYTLEELRSMTPHQIHPPGEMAAVERNIADEENGSTHRYTHVTKSGEKLQVEVHTAALEYQGRDAWITIMRDVTERVRSEEERARAEEEIRQRSRELALLNRASQALNSTLDLRQVLVTVLEEVRHLLGVVACSIWLTDPETNELVCREATGPESDVVRGWRLPPGEGLVGWVAQSGKSLIVPDTWADTRHFNGVDRQTGLKLRSILSVPLRIKQNVAGVLQAVDSEVNRFNPTDLTLVESLAATAAIAIENARLFATERQRAAALARTLEQQRELDRLKSEFIQNVSHELRTPLALAGGYAELLDKGELGELQPDQREPVTIIARRVRMLTKLVDDINAILEIGTQRLRREPVDMADLVRTVLADFQIAAEEHALTLTSQVVTGLPPITGDPVHLHRVLDNLISNALKFTPADGSITVRLGQDGANVTLEVTDTGIGIPPDKLERIFDRFYQVDGSPTRRYGGTGLGLALVKGIIEAHGGTVSVQSTVDEGSTFKVTLPPG